MFKIVGRILEISKHAKGCILISVKPLSRNISRSPSLRIHNSGSKLFSKKYLIFTNIISTAVLMFLGDVARQEMEYHQKILGKRYDYLRMARMFAVGIVVTGPLIHFWYTWLAKTWPQRTTIIVAWKILLDQTLMSPALISTFFLAMSALENKNFFESCKELREKFLLMYIADCCIWPPAQFINFNYMPVKYQVIYVNVITVVYSFVLSLIKHMPTDS